MGSMISHAIPRAHGVSGQAAHSEHVHSAVAALEGLAWMSGREAIAQFRAGGAQLVSETTPPIVRTAEHDDARIPGAYEAAHGFPTLTLLGNLNIVPEIATMVRLLATSLTFRRRLVVFQQATGVDPPLCVERFHV